MRTGAFLFVKQPPTIKAEPKAFTGKRAKKLLLMLPAAGKHQKEGIQRGMNQGSAHTR
jgi:hypothetical protein